MPAGEKPKGRAAAGPAGVRHALFIAAAAHLMRLLQLLPWSRPQEAFGAAGPALSCLGRRRHLRGGGAGSIPTKAAREIRAPQVSDVSARGTNRAS